MLLLLAYSTTIQIPFSSSAAAGLEVGPPKHPHKLPDCGTILRFSVLGGLNNQKNELMFGAALAGALDLCVELPQLQSHVTMAAMDSTDWEQFSLSEIFDETAVIENLASLGVRALPSSTGRYVVRGHMHYPPKRENEWHNQIAVRNPSLSSTIGLLPPRETLSNYSSIFIGCPFMLWRPEVAEQWELLPFLDALVPNPKLEDIAGRIFSYLLTLSPNRKVAAVHLRLEDDWKEEWRPPLEGLSDWLETTAGIEPGTPIFIVTGALERAAPYRAEMEKKFPTVAHSDVPGVPGVGSALMVEQWAMVDQLVCQRTDQFVGSEASTFTGNTALFRKTHGLQAGVMLPNSPTMSGIRPFLLYDLLY